MTKDSDIVLFDLDTFEITKRELIVGIIILCMMILVGTGISSSVVDYEENQRREYTQALRVESKDMFEYGMLTNVGNAFCYGELKAVDTVSFEDIPGTYLYVRQEREEYTKHTREVEHTGSKGKKYYTTETYYSWDNVEDREKHSNHITFMGVKFKYSKIKRPVARYIDTIYEDSNTRYLYYGVDPDNKGTIYCRLGDNTIPEHTKFYENQNIDEVKDYLCNSHALVFFWIIWIIFTGCVVFGFFYLENKWLD